MGKENLLRVVLKGFTNLGFSILTKAAPSKIIASISGFSVSDSDLKGNQKV